MRKFFIISLVLFAILGLQRLAEAHTFLSDGNITVLLHTNPDDDPIVAQPAAVLFQITDSTNKFDSSKCDCVVTISKQGKVLFTGQLLHIVGASVYDLTMPFTFPEKAVYQISVAGAPKVSGAFQSFKVQYDLRVDRGSLTSQAPARQVNVWWVIGGLFAVAIAVYAVIYLTKK